MSSRESPVSPVSTVDAWGDRLATTPAEAVLRVVSQNVSGLPASPNHIKYADLQSFMLDYSVDVLCVSETNVAWHNVSETEQLAQVVRPWFRSSVTHVAWFRDREHSSRHQPGGTAIIVRDSHTGRICGSGKDPSGLGRWVWVQLRGHHGSRLRIVSAYRPVHNPRDPGSVWSQQRAWFESQDPPRLVDPRDAFLEDLQIMLASAHTDGDQVLLALDANESSLWLPDNVVERACGSYHLANVHLSRHDRSTAPPTHNRGSRPIDGMFASATVAGGSCGYLPFGIAPGDHRALWFDIPLVAVFGVTSRPLSPRVARRLQCHDPRVVRRYHQILHEFYGSHRLAERTFQLEQSIAGPLSVDQAQEWEALDALRVQGIFLADRKCRKLRTGSVPWSPILGHALAVHRFWDRFYVASIGRHVSSKYLSRLAQKAGLDLPVAMPSEEILRHRQLAWTEYKRLKRDAPLARTAFLQQLVAARAEAGWDSATSGLTNMIRREQQRKDAALLRSVLSPTSRAGLSSVEVPIGPGDWEDGEWTGEWATRTDRAGMEQGCLAENDRRFRQASDTDLLQPRVVDILGPTGTSAASQSLLETGDPRMVEDLISPEAALYLSAHRRPSVLVASTPFRLDFRTPSYTASWQRMDEFTSSGPSGLHFGHFIANSHSPLFGSVDAALARIPALTGYLPLRWQQGLNVMLEKKPGVTKVSKLRTILLYEADFNHNNKLMGRAMMRYAEQNQLLAPEQYGSRRGHSAIYQCLNKVLTFDLLRQTKRPGALCSNDAKSCYDRIGHSSAGMAMQRCGVPPRLVDASLGPIQRLRHYIRTTYGDSTTFFSAAGHEVPVQGIGQGNGAGPAIWAVVSTPIFNAMRQRGYGIYLRSPVSGSTYMFVGYAFVDDTDLVVDGLTPSATASQVAARLQASVHFWEAALRASGGALSPAKCHWYLVDYRWCGIGWQLVSAEDEPASLKVRSPSGRMVPIERVEPTEARKTLGVWTAPNGSMNAELEYLQKKVQAWTERIRVRRLPHRLVWLSLHTGILKTLEYPLAATTFTEEDCRLLMSPLLKVGLSRSHIVRSMPRSIVHAPSSAGGFAVPNLYVEQGVAHIKAFVTFARSTTAITGFLIRNSFEYLQLELGHSANPLALDFQVWGPCAASTWLSALWRFCSCYSIALPSPVPSLSLLRTGDRYLMEAFWQRGIRSPAALARLNSCRVFLRAITLADIVTADGKYILLHAWTGAGECSRRSFLEFWPRSPPHAALPWSEWQAALVLVFGVDSRFRRLTTTLGSWALEKCVTGLTLYCPHWDRLYIPVDQDCWQTASRRPQRRGRAVYELTDSLVSLASLVLAPPLHVADVYGSGRSVSLLTTDSVPLDLWPLFPQLPLSPRGFDWSAHALRQVAPLWFVRPEAVSVERILLAIQMGSLAVFSDGSAKAGVEGTCAWGVATHDDEVALLAAGFRVPGPPEAQCSYRSELAGLLGIVVFLRRLMSSFSAVTGTVTFATDSDAVLGRIFRKGHPATVADHSWDLLSLCQSMMTGLPSLTWQWRHLKGHQDKGSGDLDIWARRNIFADSCAGAVYDQVPQHEFPIFPSSPLPSVGCGSSVVVTDLASAIRQHVLSPHVMDHWQRIGRFGHGSSDMIHWTARSDALAMLPQGRRHWITKATANRSAVGVEMVRRRQWQSPVCPRCGTHVETADHVLTCPHHEVKDCWRASLTRLERWMALRHTQPSMARAILAHLRGWMDGTSPTPEFTSIPGLRMAIDDQAALGWSNAMWGMWSWRWAEVQHAYYQFLGKRNSGRRWLALLIQQVWNTAWDQWDHRNAIFHRAEAQRRRDERCTAIRDAYRSPLCSSPAWRLLFRRPLDSRLQDPPHLQIAFLRRLSTPVASAASRSLRRQQRCLRSFFFRPSSSNRAPE